MDMAGSSIVPRHLPPPAHTYWIGLEPHCQFGQHLRGGTRLVNNAISRYLSAGKPTARFTWAGGALGQLRLRRSDPHALHIAQQHRRMEILFHRRHRAPAAMLPIQAAFEPSVIGFLSPALPIQRAEQGRRVRYLAQQRV